MLVVPLEVQTAALIIADNDVMVSWVRQIESPFLDIFSQSVNANNSVNVGFAAAKCAARLRSFGTKDSIDKAVLGQK